MLIFQFDILEILDLPRDYCRIISKVIHLKRNYLLDFLNFMKKMLNIKKEVSKQNRLPMNSFSTCRTDSRKLTNLMIKNNINV